MARAKGLLEEMEGHLGGLTVYGRDGETFVWPTHIHQPRQLSCSQLLLRERQSHNNALWRALKRTGRVYFEGDRAPYYRFMSVNTFSPVPYLRKQQYHSGNALLLPEMVVSDGPLPPSSYQLGELPPLCPLDSSPRAGEQQGQPALLTDLTRARASRMKLLLYVLKQKVMPWCSDEDLFQLDITIEELIVNDFFNVPSSLTSPYKDVHGTLSLVGDRYADPMLGFAMVRVKDGMASHQRVVTHCEYDKKYTTEEALQAAAKSYGELTGERN